MILESGEKTWLGMGVVFRDCNLNRMPGWEDGTVGYHTDDRKIVDAEAPSGGRKTTGKASNIFVKDPHWEETVSNYPTGNMLLQVEHYKFS